MDRIYKYIEEFPLFIIELRIKRSQLTKEEYWYFAQGSGMYMNQIHFYSSRGVTLIRIV